MTSLPEPRAEAPAPDAGDALCEQAVEALHVLTQAFWRAEASLAAPREESGTLRDALASVVLRLSFLLHAEARGLAPAGVGALFAELRAREPATLEARFDAWPRLLALFQAMAERGRAAPGSLFDPGRAPLLGDPGGASLPIPDLAMKRVLELLCTVAGEPVRYAQLDLERLGGVFEALLGFELVRLGAATVAVGPDHVPLDLEALLALPPAARAPRVTEQTGCTLVAGAAKALAAAESIAEAVAALGKRVSPRTPSPLPAGALLLGPGLARRRSGAHYTPRTLTEPIVREALAPLLAARPTPEGILELKVCDPAMGSGAFLLEACRQLAEALIVAEGCEREEGALAAARARVACRCLYGLDRNPGAVETAALALWLLVGDPSVPFGFLDHALHAGDALVGLGPAQLRCLDWAPEGRPPVAGGALAAATARSLELRAGIGALGEKERRSALAEADRALAPLRAAGDAVAALFFEGEDERARRAALARGLRVLGPALRDAGALGEASRLAAELCARHRLRPFHWELELPEVFGRGAPGFDVMLGNPPFLGGSSISSSFGGGYRDWLLRSNPGSHGNADLCAHFLRRAWGLLREGGTLGMITTNTIAQGDTRASALQPILREGGTLRSAHSNLAWPGAAVVVVAVLQVTRGADSGPRWLDGEPVERLNSRLRPKHERPDPVALPENAGRCFLGSKLYGEGFVLEPGERDELLARDPANVERIRPLIGGEELNRSPTQSFSRYVIDFGELSLEEAGRWPLLLERVRERVKPERDRNRRETRRVHWWRFGETCPALYAALRGRDRCLVTPRVTKHLCFSLQPTDRVFNEKINVFTFDDLGRFGVLQSRVHEAWVRLLSSTLGLGLNYSGTDCFDTFPFPEPAALADGGEVAEVGARLLKARAALMVERGEGLTGLYNRLVDPDCRDERVAGLRGLHLELDRAVCAAYGWPGPSVPPYEAQGDRKQRTAFDDEVVDRLFALNDERARGRTAPVAKEKTRRGRDERSGWLF